MAAAELLPQQIVPLDAADAALAFMRLGGVTPLLQAYFLALRAEADAALAERLPPAAGKPYPYGRCEEITRHVAGLLAARLRNPANQVDYALLAYRAAGGAMRTVWGALRGSYFQNAFQIGRLYVDVSNDTVDLTKPKVEILPMAESGLVNVRDLGHFRAIAEIYWGGRAYVNTLAPRLAPLLPMIYCSPGRLAPSYQPASDYMIALMMRDRFRQAEEWVLAGPEPPPEAWAALRARLPVELAAQTADPRAEAAAHCRSARENDLHLDVEWRDSMVASLMRMFPTA